MENINYKELLKDYRSYIKSDEALIVFLVKGLVEQVDSKSKWVDVIDYDAWGKKDDKTAFNYFIVEMFKKEIHPRYPDESKYKDKNGYKRLCKALTWEASHKDIELQRNKGKRGPMYLIICPILNKNRGKKYKKAFPFWNEEYGGFDCTGNVPTTTIYRDVDMEPEWEYRVTGVEEIDDRKFKMIKENYREFIYSRIMEKKHIEIEWFLENYLPNKLVAQKPGSIKSQGQQSKRNIVAKKPIVAKSVSTSIVKQPSLKK